MNLKNVIVRALSGAVYVALIVAGVLISDWTMIALMVLLSILAITEYSRLMHRDPSDSSRPAPLRGVNLINFLATQLAAIGIICSSNTYGLIYMMPVLVFVMIIARMVGSLYDKSHDAFVSMMKDLGALIYIALPLAIMAFLRSMTSPAIVLAIFIFIWLNDTGAFLVGCTIGRHRLFERLSPKKSWEGFWGGIVINVAASIAILCFWPEWFSMFLFGSTFVLLAVLVSVFATWGDLMESLLKRSVGVKDASHLIPGHGGILDRIDSLLLVSISISAYLIILLYLGLINY